MTNDFPGESSAQKQKRGGDYQLGSEVNLVNLEDPRRTSTSDTPAEVKPEGRTSGRGAEIPSKTIVPAEGEVAKGPPADNSANYRVPDSTAGKSTHVGERLKLAAQPTDSSPSADAKPVTPSSSGDGVRPIQASPKSSMIGQDSGQVPGSSVPGAGRGPAVEQGSQADGAAPKIDKSWTAKGPEAESRPAYSETPVARGQQIGPEGSSYQNTAEAYAAGQPQPVIDSRIASAANPKSGLPASAAGALLRDGPAIAPNQNTSEVKQFHDRSPIGSSGDAAHIPVSKGDSAVGANRSDVARGQATEGTASGANSDWGKYGLKESISPQGTDNSGRAGRPVGESGTVESQTSKLGVGRVVEGPAASSDTMTASSRMPGGGVREGESLTSGADKSTPGKSESASHADSPSTRTADGGKAATGKSTGPKGDGAGPEINLVPGTNKSILFPPGSGSGIRAADDMISRIIDGVKGKRGDKGEKGKAPSGDRGSRKEDGSGKSDANGKTVRDGKSGRGADKLADSVDSRSGRKMGRDPESGSKDGSGRSGDKAVRQLDDGRVGRGQRGIGRGEGRSWVDLDKGRKTGSDSGSRRGDLKVRQADVDKAGDRQSGSSRPIRSGGAGIPAFGPGLEAVKSRLDDARSKVRDILTGKNDSTSRTGAHGNRIGEKLDGPAKVSGEGVRGNTLKPEARVGRTDRTERADRAENSVSKPLEPGRTSTDSVDVKGRRVEPSRGDASGVRGPRADLADVTGKRAERAPADVGKIRSEKAEQTKSSDSTKVGERGEPKTQSTEPRRGDSIPLAGPGFGGIDIGLKWPGSKSSMGEVKIADTGAVKSGPGGKVGDVTKGAKSEGRVSETVQGSRVDSRTLEPGKVAGRPIDATSRMSSDTKIQSGEKGQRGNVPRSGDSTVRTGSVKPAINGETISVSHSNRGHAKGLPDRIYISSDTTTVSTAISRFGNRTDTTRTANDFSSDSRGVRGLGRGPASGPGERQYETGRRSTSDTRITQTDQSGKGDSTVVSSQIEGRLNRIKRSARSSEKVVEGGSESEKAIRRGSRLKERGDAFAGKLPEIKMSYKGGSRQSTREERIQAVIEQVKTGRFGTIGETPKTPHTPERSKVRDKNNSSDAWARFVENDQQERFSNELEMEFERDLDVGFEDTVVTASESPDEDSSSSSANVTSPDDDRPAYIVKDGDTPDFIAVTILNDASLSDLIVELNPHAFASMYDTYKQEHVAVLVAGTTIRLPGKKDIEEFRNRS